jgi:transposase
MQRGLSTMSLTEVDRAMVIEQVIEKRIKQREAGKRLNLSVRQVKRLVRQFRRTGVVSVISKQNGKPSNHRQSIEVREQIRALVETHYADFGPTYAAEKLMEVHQIKVSKETLRKELIEWGLWKAKSAKARKVHQSRERRACLGELIQLDGSHHDWFEGRGPKCCLYVLIDDATSRLVGLHFEKGETTLGYFNVVKGYIERYGVPLAFYSDKHSVFRLTRPKLCIESRTQFQRAMQALEIELICANSSQAKGRVERANSTLQNRLVKEMRLLNISSIEEAIPFLPHFIEDFNRRFSVVAKNETDAHRKLLLNPEALMRIFSIQCDRKISKNLEVSYHNKIYKIQGAGAGYRLQHSEIRVCEDLSGEITLLHKDKILVYVCQEKSQQATPILDKKALTAKLDNMVYLRKKPAPNHPWRNNSMFHTKIITNNLASQILQST